MIVSTSDNPFCLSQLEDALHEMLGASKQYEQEANKPPDKVS